MINDPRSLARALAHLEGGNAAVQAYMERTGRSERKTNPANDYDMAHMWIANPLKKGSVASKLFSTHPPMEERIARLNKLADELGL